MRDFAPSKSEFGHVGIQQRISARAKFIDAKH